MSVLVSPPTGGFGTPGSNSSAGETRESQSGLAGEDAVGCPREGARRTGSPSGSSRSRSAAGAVSLPPVPRVCAESGMGVWLAQDSQL